MAKQIIVLDRIGIPSDFSFNYVLWATVPTARQIWYAQPDVYSPGGTPDTKGRSAYSGASVAELAALKAGQIAEKSDHVYFPIGTAMSTIQAYLIARFNEWQSWVTNANPWVYYGTNWDGTTWTMGGTS